MDRKEFRFQRHLKKWEEQSKAVKRAMLAGIFFGFLLLFRVLSPFVGISDEKSDISADIGNLEQKQIAIEALIQDLNKFKQPLSTVQETIEAQPWMREKEKLIGTLSEIKRNTPRSRRWDAYQREADSTISTISRQARDTIINPLEQALNRNPDLRSSVPELDQALQDTRATIGEFEEDHLGKRWYETLVMKQVEMEDLTASLQAKMDVISTLIRSEQTKIANQRKTLENRERALEKKIDDKQELLEKLEQEMQKILPEWLRGLFSIELMLQLFPLFLIALIVYVFGSARALTRHHGFVANTIGFSETEKNDLSTSSVLTLCDKGRYGTILTLTAYVGFTLAVWLMFEWGCSLLGKWLANSNQAAWIYSKGGLAAILWIGRVLFMAALVFAGSFPFYRKRRS